MSIPLFTYVCMQIPLALLHTRSTKGPWVAKWTKLNEWFLVAMIVGLSLQWVVRLALGAM